MKSPRMRVLVFRPEEPPVVQEVDNTLESMQKLVGGYIDLLTVDNDRFGGIDLCVNDEGRVANLPYCITVKTANGNTHRIFGTAFLLRHDSEGESMGLRDEDIEKWNSGLVEWIDITAIVQDGKHRPVS